MKKQTPEKEPEQGVTAEEPMADFIKSVIIETGEPADYAEVMRKRNRESTLRQYRCAALTGCLSGMNFVGSMEDMVVNARRLGLMMLEADEKEAVSNENL